MVFSARQSGSAAAESLVAEASLPGLQGGLTIYGDFEPIERHWRHLERQGLCYVFQTYDWLQAWFQHIGGPNDVRPTIVCLTSPAGEPLALLPLCLQRRGFAKVLTWMGGVLADYHGPILVPDLPKGQCRDLLTRAIACIVQRFGPIDAIHLERQPEVLGDAPNPMIAPSAMKHRENAHFARLSSPDWESFYRSHAGSKTRATDRRKERRLADQGELSVTEVRNPKEALVVLDDMVRQRHAWSKRTGSRNHLRESGFHAFCRDMLMRHCRSDSMRLSVLRCDDAIVAAEWGLVHQNRYYYFLPTHSADDLRRYSPGRLLLRWNLQHCFDDGLAVFDFTIGNEAYKSDWCDETLELFDCLEPLSFRGKLYAIQWMLKRRLHGSGFLLASARCVRRLLWRLKDSVVGSAQ